MDKVKWVISIVVGALGTFFGFYGLIILSVALAIVFDLVSGVVKCKINNIQITSRKGTIGFWKKIALLVALAFGFFLDFFIPVAIETGISIQLGINLPFGLIIGTYIVFNEMTSIFENLHACGVQIPTFIIKLLGLSKDALNAGPKVGE